MKSFTNYLCFPFPACGSPAAKTNSNSGWFRLKRLWSRVNFAGKAAVWIDAAFALAGKKLVRVSHKFRIGSGAQLVQVHTLALSFD